MPLVKIKDFDVVINNNFFVINLWKKTEKRLKVPRDDDYINDGYITRIIKVFKKTDWHRFIKISKLQHYNILRQFNFIEKNSGRWLLKQYFYYWKAAKKYSKLFFGLIKCNRTMQIMEHNKYWTYWMEQMVLGFWQEITTFSVIYST